MRENTILKQWKWKWSTKFFMTRHFLLVIGYCFHLLIYALQYDAIFHSDSVLFTSLHLFLFTIPALYFNPGIKDLQHSFYDIIRFYSCLTFHTEIIFKLNIFKIHNFSFTKIGIHDPITFMRPTPKIMNNHKRIYSPSGQYAISTAGVTTHSNIWQMMKRA